MSTAYFSGAVLTAKEYNVRSGSSFSVRCNHLSSQPQTVAFTLLTSSSRNLDLGSCFNASCSSPINPNVTFSHSTTSTQITFSGVFVTRDLAGQMMCSYSHNGLLSTDSAPLNVYGKYSIWKKCGLAYYRTDKRPWHVQINVSFMTIWNWCQFFFQWRLRHIYRFASYWIFFCIPCNTFFK